MDNVNLKINRNSTKNKLNQKCYVQCEEFLRTLLLFKFF